MRIEIVNDKCGSKKDISFFTFNFFFKFIIRVSRSFISKINSFSADSFLVEIPRRRPALILIGIKKHHNGAKEIKTSDEANVLPINYRSVSKQAGFASIFSIAGSN